MKLMKKIILGTLMISSLFSDVSAATKIVEADGEYSVGHGNVENFAVAEQRAQEDAIRNASMKGSTFVRSVLKSVDKILTANEITLVTSSILEVQDSKFEYDTNSDKTSVVIHCHVFVLVDTDKVEKSLGNKIELEKTIRDKKAVEDERDRLQKEVEYWKNLATKTTSTTEREEINQKIKQNEDQFTATQYFERGNNYYYEKKYSEAIDEYTKAIELDPKYASAYNNRGVAYGYLKKYDEAIRDLNKSIELNPNDADTYVNRGSIAYANAFLWDEAKQYYEKALEIDPKSSLAYYACYKLGTIYQEYGVYDRAIKYFSMAIEANPNYANAYRDRGFLYRAFKQDEKALADYNKAIELNPNDELSYDYRAWLYSDLERYEEIIADCTKQIELKLKEDKAYIRRGDAYKALGNLDQALKDYTRAIELNPNNAEAYNSRGIAYANLGKYDQAIQDYTRAIDEEKVWYILGYDYNRRGLIYEKIGKYSEALADFQKAVELDPKDEKFKNNLARLQKKIKK